MKKFILCVFMMCVILFPNAYASGGATDVSVKEVSCLAITENIAYGYFEVCNDSAIYFPELKYIMYLMPESAKHDIAYVSSAYKSSNIGTFSLNPLESKIVAYEFDVSNVPTNSYYICVVLADNTSMIGGIYNEEMSITIGEDMEYIAPIDELNANYYKIKEYEYPLSGPYMEAGESPEAYIKVKSGYKENISVIPEFTVYKREAYYNTGSPIAIRRDKEIGIKAGETKELKLKLPVISEPDSYYIKVRLLNKDYKSVSKEYYFRYVVNGASAKVSLISTLYDSSRNVLKIFNTVIGSSDGTTEIEDAVIETGVYRTDDYNRVEMYIDKDPLYPMMLTTSYLAKTPDDKPDLIAYVRITSGDNVLAYKEVRLKKDEVYSTGEKIKDIKDTNYELAVKMLNSYGVISGYPDGTFKPAKTLSRAELTSIALNILRIDLSNYEVKNNAFTDVPENHWAYKSINYAYENGIINGYGNGLFKPNNEVKYGEAITILINVIGYGEQAKSSELTWPNNYINTAKELYITDNTYTSSFDFTKPANRGDVANLTLNSYILRRGW